MRTTDIAVIGAGPYGLSISAHLSGRGIDHEIFGRPMSSWRDFMPAEMMLRSEPHASNLWDPQRRFTLQAFCAEKGLPYVPSGQPVPLARFLDYTDWFQRQAVPGVRDQELTKLAQRDGGFELQFSDGDICRATNVIIATGHRAFCNVPDAIATLPPELWSHSSDHRDLGRFKGREVTVLGAGQSSLETAAILHERGAYVRIVTRDDRVSWNPPNDGKKTLLRKILSPEAGLGFGWRSVAASEFPQVFALLPRELRLYLVARTWGPSGAWWLKDRVQGRIPILTSQEIIGATTVGSRIRLSLRSSRDTNEIAADHVIAATGFRADVGRLSFLDTELKVRVSTFGGAPHLDRFGESSVPGLYFAGILAAPTFGPVMRFMFGAKHAAPALAHRFARHQPQDRSRSIPVVARD